MLCDCAILIGVPDPEIFNGSLGVEPDFFDKTPLVNIDVSSVNKLYGEVNLVDNKKTALAEIVYELATTLNSETLDADSATLLLAAVFEKTGGLRASLSADVLLTASELLRLGARKEEATSLAKEAAPVALLQLFGRAAVRSKLQEIPLGPPVESREIKKSPSPPFLKGEQEVPLRPPLEKGEYGRGVLWSFLTAEDFEKTGRSKDDISRVLQNLGGSFPPHGVRILLWQDSVGGRVSATLAGDEYLLQKINGLAPSQFQSPDLRLEASFESFREGEVHIASLLKGVL